MNKNCFRVVFNLRRGQCMAVREDASSDQVGQEGSSSVVRQSFSMKWISFCVAFMHSAVVMSAPIVADPHAGPHRPLVDQSHNGKPVVQIVAPNASGLSHNQYHQFNVPGGGAILNNSGQIVQTQQAGLIDGNPHLQNAPSATVILNEVTQHNPSKLQGYLEVAGPNAQVIVANPSGIYCHGCGFINTDRAMLTTGKPLFGGSGSLDAFRVSAGKIRIEGAGLDARTTRAVDILTRALEVHGKMYAKDKLNVITGVQDVAYQDLQTSNQQEADAPPRLAIDIGALGGMYAGKIFMVANEKGLGVNHEGYALAGAGDFDISSAGKIVIKGKSQAQNIHMQAQALDHQGQSLAQGQIDLQVTEDVHNTGSLESASLNLEAEALSNSGSITQSDQHGSSHIQVAHELRNTGTLHSQAHESHIQAGYLENQGTLQALGDHLTVQAEQVDNQGHLLHQGQTFHLQSDHLQNSGELSGSGQIQLSGNDLSNTGSIQSQKDMSLSFAQAIEQKGQLKSASSLSMHTQDLNNTGHIASSGATLSIDVAGDVTNQGKIVHTGSDGLTLNTQGQLDNSSGLLGSTANLDIDAVGLENIGGTVQGAKLNLDVHEAALNNEEGKILSTVGDLVLESGYLNNTAGLMQSAGGFTLNSHAQDVLNDQGQLVSAGSMQVFVGSLKQNAGHISSLGSLHLEGINFEQHQASISAKDDMLLHLAGAFLNAGQVESSGHHMQLTVAGDVTNQGKIVHTGGDGLTLNTQGQLDNSAGLLGSTANLDIEAVGLENAGGTVQGVKLNLDVHEAALNNEEGKILSTVGDLVLESGYLNNTAGLIQSAESLALNTHGQDFINDHTQDLGTQTLGLISQEDMSITTGHLQQQSGEILSLGSLNIQAQDIKQDDGLIQAKGDVAVKAQQFIQNHAVLVSEHDVSVSASGGLDNRFSSIQGQNIHLHAPVLHNQEGRIQARGDLTLEQGELRNEKGQVHAGNLLSIRHHDGSRQDSGVSLHHQDGSIKAGSIRADIKQLTGYGELFSQGDGSWTFWGDQLFDQSIHSNGNLNIINHGRWTHTGHLQAAGRLSLQAPELYVTQSGQLLAQNVRVDAAYLHNQGLLHGMKQTWIQSQSLDNLGTGRIYADRIHIQAERLNNDTRNGKAAVIAARETLVIGAKQIHNREGSELISLGDLFLGGFLNEQGQIQGQAELIHNASARIEAEGNIQIASRELKNTNEHFASEVRETGRKKRVLYRPAGHEHRYDESEVGFHWDENMVLEVPGLTPTSLDGKGFEEYTVYDVTETTYQSVVTQSMPALIKAHGSISLAGSYVLNDKSQIIAGQDVHLRDVAKLDNLEAQGIKYVHQQGRARNHWRHQSRALNPRGVDKDGWSDWYAINDRFPNQSIALQVAGIQEHQNTAGMTHKPPASAETQQGAWQGVGEALVSGQTHNTAEPLKPSSQNPLVPIHTELPEGVQIGLVNVQLPSSSLFQVDVDRPGYLIETDSQFTQYGDFISSVYMLERLGHDPEKTLKRLGDGYYEQRLVNDQITQITGKPYHGNYASTQEQYLALLQAGVTFAEEFELIPGVALTAEQMARLTGDIVWLVEKTVQLADGRQEQVLVPKVYLKGQDRLQGQGSMIAAGGTLNAQLDTLNNSATLQGQHIDIQGTDLNNLGGTIQGHTVNLEASGNIQHLGGLIEAEESLQLNAAQDLLIASNLSQNEAHQIIGQVAHINTTQEGSTLNLQAGENLHINAAQVDAAGSLNVQAGGDVQLNTLTENHHYHEQSSNGQADYETSTALGSSLSSQGAMHIQAGGDLISQAASVVSDTDLSAVAGGNIHIDSAQNTSHIQESHHHTDTSGGGSSQSHNSQIEASEVHSVGSNWQAQNMTLHAAEDINIQGSYLNTDENLNIQAGQNIHLGTSSNSQVGHSQNHTDKDSLLSSGSKDSSSSWNHQTQQGSMLSAGSVNLSSGQNTDIQASHIVADHDIHIQAGGDLTLSSATDSHEQSNFQHSEQSGFFTSGNSITLGSKEEEHTQHHHSTQEQTSTLGSLHGDIQLTAGAHYQQTGGQLVAPEGDLSIQAQSITLNAATDTEHWEQTNHSEQAGLSIGVSSPLITAAQNIEQGLHLTENIDDDRYQAVAAAATAMAAANAVNAVQDLQAQGLNAVANVSISLGFSEQSDASGGQSSSQHGAQLQANNISLTATEGDITGVGSQIQAHQDLNLHAAQDIQFTAAQHQESHWQESDNQSASIGVSFGAGGIAINGSFSQGEAQGNGMSLEHDNSHLSAGHTLNLVSGEHTHLQGTLSAPEVNITTGGDLHIESVQDFSEQHYESEQTGFSASYNIVGAGGGASVSHNSTNISGSMANVAEQAGVHAGDGGFHINVGGHTELTGATLTGSGENELTTESLGFTDLQNHSDFEGSSTQLNAGLGINAEDLRPQGGPPVIVNEDKDENGSTQSAISPADITLTGEQDNGEAIIQTLTDRDPEASHQGVNELYDQESFLQHVEAVQLLSQEANAFMAHQQQAIDKLKDDIEAIKAQNPDDPRLQALQNQLTHMQNQWGMGGTYSTALNALVMAAGSNAPWVQSALAKLPASPRCAMD